MSGRPISEMEGQHSGVRLCAVCGTDVGDATGCCPGCGSPLDHPFAVILPRSRQVPVVRRIGGPGMRQRTAD